MTMTATLCLSDASRMFSKRLAESNIRDKARMHLMSHDNRDATYLTCANTHLEFLLCRKMEKMAV